MGAGTSAKGLKDTALGIVGAVIACTIMGYGLYYLWGRLSWFWIIVIVGVWGGIFVYDSRIKARQRRERYKKMEEFHRKEERREREERQKEQGNVATDVQKIDGSL